MSNEISSYPASVLIIAYHNSSHPASTMTTSYPADETFWAEWLNAGFDTPSFPVFIVTSPTSSAVSLSVSTFPSVFGPLVSPSASPSGGLQQC